MLNHLCWILIQLDSMRLDPKTSRKARSILAPLRSPCLAYTHWHCVSFWALHCELTFQTNKVCTAYIHDLFPSIFLYYSLLSCVCRWQKFIPSCLMVSPAWLAPIRTLPSRMTPAATLRTVVWKVYCSLVQNKHGALQDQKKSYMPDQVLIPLDMHSHPWTETRLMIEAMLAACVFRCVFNAQVTCGHGYDCIHGPKSSNTTQICC